MSHHVNNIVVAARRPVISSTNLGPLLNIFSWMVMVIMCLTVLTVIISKYIAIRKFKLDDGLITAAMMFAIAQTICVSIAVANGLGDSVQDLTPHKLDVYQKSTYASRQLYIVALFFAKKSTLALLRYLTPDKHHQRLITSTAAVVALWALGALIPSLFLCSLPRPWATEDGKCLDIVSFWTVIGVLDIVTEILIMALPIYIILGLQLASDKKLAVIFAFAFRVLTIVAIIVRVAFLAPAFHNPDFSLAAFPWAIATQLEICLSIFSCCVPYLKPFMESLDVGFISGVVRVDVYGQDSRVEEAKPGRSSGWPDSARPTSKSSASNTPIMLNANAFIGDVGVPPSPSDRGSTTFVTSQPTATRKNNVETRSVECEEIQPMAIKQTTEWKISYGKP